MNVCEKAKEAHQKNSHVASLSIVTFTHNSQEIRSEREMHSNNIIIIQKRSITRMNELVREKKA